MARPGTAKAAAAAALLLVLVTTAAIVDAAPEMTTAAAVAIGRGGLRRGHPMGLKLCVAGCGTTVISCLLDCYGPSGAVGTGGRSLLPICLLDCTNDAMFCAIDCSTQALN